jgi:hypothetical protein
MVALILSSALFACATDATIADTGDAGAGGPGIADDTGTTADATPTCVDHCADNSDCQSSCPSISGDVNCCDTSTGRCYLSAASTCPAPVPDSGVIPAAY